MGLLGLGRSGAQRRLLARFGRNGVRGQGTSRGFRSFLPSRWHQAGLATILQPVALAADVDGRRVMQQPVQDRRGENSTGTMGIFAPALTLGDPYALLPERFVP